MSDKIIPTDESELIIIVIVIITKIKSVSYEQPLRGGCSRHDSINTVHTVIASSLINTWQHYKNL